MTLQAHQYAHELHARSAYDSCVAASGFCGGDRLVKLSVLMFATSGSRCTGGGAQGRSRMKDRSRRRGRRPWLLREYRARAGLSCCA
jgi:hypothetical protein